MLRSLVVLSLFLASACADGNITIPGAPPPPAPPGPGPLTYVWGMVIEDHGGCVDSASVRVVHGQGLDRSATQETPCDIWSFGGFRLNDLVAGLPLTIRASAPGYETLDRTITPSSGPQTAFAFVLKKLGNAHAPGSR